jgi:hypothetical protein
MPIIPRTQETGQLQMQNQPTMPIDALSGPGRALQSLGGAISGLQGAFEAASEPSDDQKFQAQMTTLQFDNEARAELDRRKATYTPDQSPAEFSPGYQEWYEQKRAEYQEKLPGHPKIRQGYMLQTERLKGPLYGSATEFGTNETIKGTVNSTASTLKGTIATLSPEDPAFIASVDRLDEQIDRIPGASPEQREWVRKQASDTVKEKLQEAAGKDPGKALEAAEKIVTDWGNQLKADPPPAEQAPAVGAPPGAGAAPGAQPAPPIKPELGTPEKQSSRPADPVEFLTAKLAPGYEQRVGDVKDLHPATKDRLGAFLAAAEDEGHDIRVVSGYRSPERQAALWKNAVKKYGSPAAARKWVAPPGGSSHNSGEAVDLQFQDRGAGLGGKRTESVKWAHANAKKFGLTFPLGHEDWHIEPVEAREGGKRYGGNYAKGDSYYAKYAGTGQQQMALGGPGSAADIGAPKDADPKAVENAVAVAGKIGVSPRAVGEIFSMESGWNPKTRTGSYMGLSQIGPDTLAEMGVSKAEYQKMSQAEQAAFYGKWLDHYKFSEKMQAAGVDLSTLPPARQAAILQAFQFAPNGEWIKRLAQGDTKTPVTTAPQAKRLGSTSIADMEGYYSGRMGKAGQPVAEAAPAQSAPQPEAPKPVAERSFTSFYGLTKPGSTATPEQGKIPSEAVAGQAQADAGERGENAIPGPAPTQTADASGGTAPPAPATPRWKKPSIRSYAIEGIAEQLPSLRKAAAAQLDGLIQRAEGVAGDGVSLPDEEKEATRLRVEKSGTPEQKARFQAALQTQEYRHGLKAMAPEAVGRIATGMRAQIAAGGATPERMALVEAVEKQAKRGAEALSNDPYSYAVEAGVLPGKSEIDLETLSPKMLTARAEQRKVVQQTYGEQYGTFFDPEEKKKLEGAILAGGSQTTQMLGFMYEAFGEDMPAAIAEIAPKNPELVRAGYLMTTDGDTQAVDDIAETVARRKDENYQGPPKFEKTELQADYKKVALNLFPGDARRTDEIMASAKAIYEARVEDPADYNAELFRESVALALGQRKDAKGAVFGGVMAQSGAGWNASDTGNAVQIPSDIRQDMFNTVLDGIRDTDLVEVGHPVPADRYGTPMPILRALSRGRFVQVGPRQYAISHDEPGKPGQDRFLMTAAAPKQSPDEITTGDVAASMKQGGGQLFVLDLDKLSPALKARYPSAFWK